MWWFKEQSTTEYFTAQNHWARGDALSKLYTLINNPSGLRPGYYIGTIKKTGAFAPVFYYMLSSYTEYVVPPEFSLKEPLLAVPIFP